MAAENANFSIRHEACDENLNGWLSALLLFSLNQKKLKAPCSVIVHYNGEGLIHKMTSEQGAITPNEFVRHIKTYETF